jgi:hypothetical protein
LVEAGVKSKSFSHDGNEYNEYIDGDEDPDLGLDGVLARAKEGLDAEVGKQLVESMT